jgi:hypothetical protein
LVAILEKKSRRRPTSYFAIKSSSSICPPRVAEPEAVLDRSGRGEIVTATAAALIIGVLVSLGAVYGLNRYLGPSVDPAETTGALHHRTPTD